VLSFQLELAILAPKLHTRSPDHFSNIFLLQ